MRRVLLIVGIGIAMLSMLCVGLALGMVFTPARAQIERTIERVINRAEVKLQALPLIQTRVLKSDAQQDEPGILIAGVIEDSPAEQAGLQRGDILLAVEGHAVNTFIEVQKNLQSHEPGDEVDLRVQRGEREITLTATLEESPGEGKSVFLGILPCNCRLSSIISPDEFMLDIFQGVHILEVTPGSPAEEAGLEAGQVITAIDGQALRRMTDLTRAIADHKPGDRVELTVKQGSGEAKGVPVALGENPDQPGTAWLGIRFGPPIQIDPERQMPWMPESGDGILPDMPRGRLGIFPPGRLDLDNLQPGALIREVVADSPAEEAGLQTGQIIQAVDGKALDGPEKLRDLIAGHKPGDTITLTVLDTSAEDGQTREVKVTLGEDPDQPGKAWLGIRFIYLDFQRLNPENLPEG